MTPLLHNSQSTKISLLNLANLQDNVKLQKFIPEITTVHTGYTRHLNTPVYSTMTHKRDNLEHKDIDMIVCTVALSTGHTPDLVAWYKLTRHAQNAIT